MDNINSGVARVHEFHILDHQFKWVGELKADDMNRLVQIRFDYNERLAAGGSPDEGRKVRRWYDTIKKTLKGVNDSYEAAFVRRCWLDFEFGRNGMKEVVKIFRNNRSTISEICYRNINPVLGAGREFKLKVK